MLILLFIFWTIFWSFGSVIIWRLHSKFDISQLKWVLMWRSECVKCNSTLWVIDLVPVVSRLFLWWKCRKCKTKISSFYPILEIVTWLVFVWTYLYLKASLWIDLFIWISDWNILLDQTFLLNFIFWLVLNWVLTLILFGDILFFEINIINWLFITFWILWWEFSWYIGDYQLAFWWWIAFFTMFYAIHIFSKFYVKFRYKENDLEWFGIGDVMIGFTVWLLFPLLNNSSDILFSIIDTWLKYVIISCVLWIIFYWISYSFKRWKLGNSIPFLPAMIVGFWIMLIISLIN